MLGLKISEGHEGARKGDRKSKERGAAISLCYKKKGQCKELSIENNSQAQCAGLESQALGRF